MFEVGHPPTHSAHQNLKAGEAPKDSEQDNSSGSHRLKKEEGEQKGSKLKNFRHKRSHSHTEGKQDGIERNDDEDAKLSDSNRAESSPALSRRGTTALMRRDKKKDKIREKGKEKNSHDIEIKRDHVNKAKNKDIEVSLCYKFEKLWDDSKTGAMPFEISIYRVTPPAGYHCLGDYYEQAQHSTQQPENLNGFFAVKETTIDGIALLAEPTGYQKMWDDRGIGSKFGPVSIWRPLPPQDYVCMGHVVTISQSDAPPSTSIVRCVHKDFVQESQFASLLIWCDKKTGSKLGGISLWDRQIALNDKEFLPGTFISHESHNPPKEPLYVFSRSSLSLPGCTLLELDYISLVAQMMDPENGLKTTKKKTVFKSYKCFTGAEAVEWVANNQSLKKRKDATAVCEYLRRAGIMLRDQEKTKSFSEVASFRFKKRLEHHMLSNRREEDIFSFPLTGNKNLSKKSSKKKEPKKIMASSGDVLILNSIYKMEKDVEPEIEDSPNFFGSALGQILQDQQREDSVPLIVEKCIEFLRLEPNINSLGLFRLNGKNHENELLKKEFSSPSGGASLDLVQLNLSPHSVANVLKYFIRSLPESVFTTDLYLEWIAAADHTEDDILVEKVGIMLKKLPPMNYRLLSILFGFFYDVSLHAAENKMTASNLARVIGPNFTRDTPDQTKFLYETNATVTLMEKMILHYNTLFPEAAAKPQEQAEPAQTVTEILTPLPIEQKEAETPAITAQAPTPIPAQENKTNGNEPENAKDAQKGEEKEIPKPAEEKKEEPAKDFVFNYVEVNDLSAVKQTTVLANHKKLFEQKIAASQPKSREAIEAEVRNKPLPSGNEHTTDQSKNAEMPKTRPALPPHLLHSAVRLVAPGKALNNAKLFEEKIAAAQPKSEEELVAQVHIKKPHEAPTTEVSAASSEAPTPTPTASSSAAGGTPVKGKGDLASKLALFEKVAAKEAEAAAAVGTRIPPKTSRV